MIRIERPCQKGDWVEWTAGGFSHLRGIVVDTCPDKRPAEAKVVWNKKSLGSLKQTGAGTWQKEWNLKILSRTGTK